MSTLVTYQFKDAIATIAMDDSKANVMSVRMLSELNSAFDRAITDRAVVVLTGRPGVEESSFITGTSIVIDGVSPRSEATFTVSDHIHQEWSTAIGAPPPGGRRRTVAVPGAGLDPVPQIASQDLGGS